MLDTLLITLLITLAALAVVFTMAAYAVYAERRVAALIQQRDGPNRVGPFGLLQPLADVLKLVLKEDFTPDGANKLTHFLAPAISTGLAVAALGILPFARDIHIFDTNFGVLYLFAVNSLAVYGVTFAGWSSNSKYSLLGGLRASAQMLSYELSMGLALVSILLLTSYFHSGEGVLKLTSIVEAQTNVWFIFLNPLGFFIFVTCAFAEANRAPFDLVEAEQELVGGFHTEYSSMKFGAFFVAEYMHVIIASMVISTLFLGGYLGPLEGSLYTITDWPLWAQILWGVSWFLAKTIFFIFVFIWVRWTLPRFKYNQLMDIGWKKFIPLGLLNIIVIAFVLALIQTMG
jgi:NADH-quinone oxidoreductase subunit H